MKNFVLILICFLTAQTVIAAPQYPKLFFSYSSLYDSICSQTPDNKVDPAWAQEASERELEFQTLWETQGHEFMDKLIELFGYGFVRSEMTATLSVCENTPSYSDPLVLNVSRFLKSYQNGKPALAGFRFIELVFHELLHTFVGEHLNRPTPLILKYKSEDRVTRNHLHLMAVQKYVYTAMNRTDLLDFLEKRYTTIKSPAYQRAWEIVTKIEGHDAFVLELVHTPSKEAL